MKQQDLVDRYVYNVIRHVPKAQRNDIKLELESLIEDMCESEDSTVEDVLLELGDPVEFAKQYTDQSNYLISPDYFDTFQWVLKIVLLCTLISAFASTIVHMVGTTSIVQLAGISSWQRIIRTFVQELCINAITSTLGAFGLVTIVFAILERYHVKLNRSEISTWSPKNLAPIPDSKYLVSKGDCIANMIFCTLFGALLLYCPQLFGAFRYENGVFLENIPVFNLDQWSSILPIFLAILALGLVDSIIQLFIGVYSRMVLISTVIFSVIQFGLLLILFKTMPVFNPTFAKDLSQMFELSFPSQFDLLSYWNTHVMSNVIILVVFLVTCLEIGYTVYKCIQYERTIQ